MAQNEITLKITVSDDGSLKIVTDSANKAKKAVDGLTKSKDRGTKSSNAFNKAEKGVAGATSNGTKAFSKQAQTLGGSSGIVAAYATLAANIFAITAAFGALRRAAGLEQLEQGLIRVGNAAGANLPQVATRLREITGAAVSTQEAMTAVALGTSAGFSTAQLEGITKVAKGASLALGRDMGDALSRLTRGAAKLEPEILDELGIMVRLDDATENYAATVGKTAAQLTQFERRMAFTNAIIDQGTEKFGDIAKAIDPNPYDQLAASFDDLTKTTLKWLNIPLKPLVSFLSYNIPVLAGTVVLFASTISKQMLPSLYKAADALADQAVALQDSASEDLKKIKTLKTSSKAQSELEKKIREGTATDKEKRKAVTNLKIAESSRAKKLEDISNKESAHFAKKQSELNAITAARRRLTDAINAEAAAEQKALILGQRADAINLISNRNFVEGFKAYTAANRESIIAYKENIAGQSLLRKSTATLSTGFSIAKFSVKAFGTALLASLPLIGQIISIGGLLYPLFKKLFGLIKSSKPDVSEFTEGFESFSKISDQLTNSIDKTTDSVKQYTLTLRASVGVLDQVTAAVSALNSAEDKQQQEILTKLYEQRRKTLENLNSEQLRVAKVLIDSGLSITEVYNKQKEVTFDVAVAAAEYLAIEKQINEVRAKGLKIDADKSLAILDTAINNIRATTSLEQGLKEQIAVFEQVKQDVVDGVITSKNEFREALASAYQVPKETIASIEQASTAYSSFLKTLNAFAGTKKSPIDNLIDSTVSLKAEIDKAAKGGPLALAALADRLPTSFVEAAKGASNLSTFTGELVQRAKDYRDTLKKSVVRIKDLETQLKGLRSLQKESAELSEAYYEAEDRIIRLKQKDLSTQISLLVATGKTKETQQEIQVLLQKIVALENSRTSAAKRAYEATTATLKQEKEILNLRLKQSTGSREGNSLLKESLELTAKINALKDPTRVDKSLTANEELKILEQTSNERDRIAKLELDLKYTAFDLEMKAIRARYKLLEDTAKEEDKSVDYSEGKALLDKLSLEKTARLTLEQEIIDKRKEYEKEYLKNKRKEEIVTAADTGNTTYDRLLNVDAKGSIKDLGTLRKKMGVVNSLVSPMTEELSKLGASGELVSTVTKGAFAIADAWAQAGERIGKSSSNLAKGAALASAAGQTLGAIGSIVAASAKQEVEGVDQAIEAEKRRDGKSKESLAKIKALEAKKDAINRKAFEKDKKLKMGQAVMSGATAVMQALASSPFPANFVIAGITAALTAAQVAIIAGSSYQGTGASGAANVPTSVNLGERSNSVDLARANSASGEQAYIRGERGIGSSASNFTPAFTGMRHRANGGATTGYMVGEKGPELFVPDTPGVIKPADDTEKMGNTVQVNFQISTIDTSSVESMLTSNRGTIIKNIRDAANQHGEFFLENIREDSLT